METGSFSSMQTSMSFILIKTSICRSTDGLLYSVQISKFHMCVVLGCKHSFSVLFWHKIHCVEWSYSTSEAGVKLSNNRPIDYSISYLNYFISFENTAPGNPPPPDDLGLGQSASQYFVGGALRQQALRTYSNPYIYLRIGPSGHAHSSFGWLTCICPLMTDRWKDDCRGVTLLMCEPWIAVLVLPGKITFSTWQSLISTTGSEKCRCS